MKHYPRNKPPRHPARLPAFVPVPLRARSDGWTAQRQAAFLVALARTRSVSAAARAVTMARETAYRLRRHPGGASFAAAWDRILQGANAARRKVTGRDLAARAMNGLIRPVVHRGELAGLAPKPDNSALLRYLAQLDRGRAAGDAQRGRSQGSAGGSASTLLRRDGADQPFLRIAAAPIGRPRP